MALIRLEDREQDFGDDRESLDRDRIADLQRGQEFAKIGALVQRHAVRLRKLENARRDRFAAGVRWCCLGRQGHVVNPSIVGRGDGRPIVVNFSLPGRLFSRIPAGWGALLRIIKVNGVIITEWISEAFRSSKRSRGACLG
jgi:hypothetical protein